MRIQHSPDTIYVTRLDYQRLIELVRQEHPAASCRPVAALEQELTRAQLVESYAILPDVVTMSSRLKLRRLCSTEVLEFTLVYPHEANESQRRVSVLSPLGIAVLGCRLGDRLLLPQPDGAVRYWVEAILHQPEAAGDWVS